MGKDVSGSGSLTSFRFLIGIFLLSSNVCEGQDQWLGKILSTKLCSELNSFQTMGQLSKKHITDGGMGDSRAKECEYYSWPKCDTPGSCKITTKNLCAGEGKPGEGSGTSDTGTPVKPNDTASAGSPEPGPPTEPGGPSTSGTGDGQMWLGKILSKVLCSEMSSFQSMGKLSNKHITDGGLSSDRGKECEWYSWPKCATPGSCKITTKSTCDGNTSPVIPPPTTNETDPGPGPPPGPPPEPTEGPKPGPPTTDTGSASGTSPTGQWIGKTLSTILCSEMTSFQSMGKLSNKHVTDAGAAAGRGKECDWFSRPHCASPEKCKVTTKKTC